MLSHIRPALVLIAAFTAILGVAYPLAVTGIAQVAMPHQANGSLILAGGKIVGSELIGQNFTGERYIHPRPSATTAADPSDAAKTVAAPYNAASSGGSNYGPSSAALVAEIRERAAVLGAPAPGDAVTASASGLDPHISPAAAEAQVARLAKARNLDPARIRSVIEAFTERPLAGVIGEPRVNVLRTNLALDALKQ